MDRTRLNAIVDLEISDLRRRKRAIEEQLRAIQQSITVLGSLQKEYNIAKGGKEDKNEFRNR